VIEAATGEMGEQAGRGQTWLAQDANQGDVDEAALHDHVDARAREASSDCELAAAVDDEAVGEVVRRHRDGHAITRHDFDVEPAQPATDASKEGVSLIALDAEVTARESFHHATLNLNEIVSCHSMPFRRSLSK
jgi:hypothetical protein